jgi:hypothetical protein
LPHQFVGPTGWHGRLNAAPTQHRRIDFGVMLRMDVEKARAEWSREPFVATGGVIIATERVERERKRRDGVRPVDTDPDAAIARELAQFRRRSAT